MSDKMQQWDPRGAPVLETAAVYEELLDFKDAKVLDLGCGNGAISRAIAKAHKSASVTALEVDTVQHEANLAGPQLPNLEFGLGGAERIPAEDETFDIVLMMMSLHHVPLDGMAQALREVRRVLLPGGLLYVAEPPFAGAFNAIIRLFHDEREARAAAFAALETVVASGGMALVTEKFFLTPLHVADFADFEARFINTTHTKHNLSPAQREAVEKQLKQHMTPKGADFQRPMRVDLLRKLS
ncbi:MAG: class I SAM-dependent methyltransferase [Rhodospirillaceae bacterium]|nr:class I SAM-dependent methyltransferase [Rhodospirillaceae bacterium]